MNFVSLGLIFMVSIATAATCLTSSESYASEVVVPNYDMVRAEILGDKTGDYVFLPSQYDPDLIVLLQESTTPKGLSVRLQKPTQVKEVIEPHIKIISTLDAVNIRKNLDKSWYGWSINCDFLSCSFEKDSITLTAPNDGIGQQVALEINKDLQSCTSSCSGYCLTLTNYSVCIDVKTKQEIDSILRYSNITSSSNKLFSSYRIAGTEGIKIRDIVSTYNKTVDWKEAMKTELLYLNSQKVISLSKEEIDSISEQSREGQAGYNYRIVFDTNSSSWMPYYQTHDAMLSSDRDCQSYSTLSNNTPTVEPSGWSTFYVVPLILSISGIFLMLFLILIARFITAPKRKKKSSA